MPSITIGKRFRGPPNSGNGGYVCGLLAGHIDGRSAEITLRAPPPLARPLNIVPGAHGAMDLRDGDRILATGRSAQIEVSEIPTASSAAMRRRRVETIRGVTSSASKEEDGTVKHVDADIFPVFSATGELAEIIAAAVDVTERRRAEKALRRGEVWLAQAQRLSHTGTWVMNGTTRRFLYWSDESYRIWGFDPLQGLPSRDDMWGRIHPDDRERLWEEVQEALREQRDFFEEFRILLPDGRGQIPGSKHPS
jgi:PAS domain-containing protein